MEFIVFALLLKRAVCMCKLNPLQTSCQRREHPHSLLLLEYLRDFGGATKPRILEQQTRALTNILYVTMHDTWRSIFHPLVVVHVHPAKEEHLAALRTRMPTQLQYM